MLALTSGRIARGQSQPDPAAEPEPAPAPPADPAPAPAPEELPPPPDPAPLGEAMTPLDGPAHLPPETDLISKPKLSRNFAGSIQLDYMAVPSRDRGREISLDGATAEVSLKLAMDFTQ